MIEKTPNIRNVKYNKKLEKKGILRVSEKIVSIETSGNWQGIEIDYKGNIQIESLLPDDYIVKIGEKKILVIKFNNRDEILSDLFEYKGQLNIIQSIMASKDFKTTTLYIDNSRLQLWDTLIGSVNKERKMILKDWAYLGENWEDLSFNGNNIKNYYSYRKKVYDKESKSYVDIKEKRVL